jgi:dienelactone hydrolase
MKQSILFIFILLSYFFNVSGQNKDSINYGITRNMPLFYKQMKEQLSYPMAWEKSSIKNFNRWRNEARKQVFECMRNVSPAPDNYNMEIIDTEKRNGYEIRRITFNLSSWYRVPAYLLVPQGKGPFPAIVMLHDHGAHFSIGKEKMIRPFDVKKEVLADADDWSTRCYDGQYTGDYFAEHGYVVLSVDALFWGERAQKEGPSYEGQQALASNFLQMGASWSAFITMDDIRSTDFLASLSFVNASKIGCLGFSMGGYRSWMLSALTDRIKASASICWMNTTEYLMDLSNNQNKGGSAYSMLIPNIRLYLDYPHVASIACPKPSLFFNGTKDKLFPVKGVEDAYSILHKVWNSQHASEKLVTKLWDEKHFFNKRMQKETLEFFDKWLK